MNEKKFCLIACINDDLYEAECLHYADRLKLPDGCTLEYRTIREAASMTEGYQAGMESSDAKYKIYIHQDVFLLDDMLLFKLLEVFEDETVGMIGMVGSPKLPESGIMWDGERVGHILACSVAATEDVALGEAQTPYSEVEAVDGLFIATQYDLPWRSDLFQGWDMYDISQSFEFRKAGKKVVVPNMDHAMVLHDDGFTNLGEYFKWLDVFLKTYR